MKGKVEKDEVDTRSVLSAEKNFLLFRHNLENTAAGHVITSRDGDKRKE